MRVYRRYHCDYAHEWILIREQGAPEDPRDAYCPEGHEAVTCQEQPPADEVQIVLRPAARIVDPVTGQVELGGRYFVALLDRADEELCVSSQHFDWDEAVRLAARFRGKDKARALEWWGRKPP